MSHRLAMRHLMKRLLDFSKNNSSTAKKFLGVVGGSGVIFGGVSFYTSTQRGKVFASKLAADAIEITNFMDSPISDIRLLENNKNDMKAKMELMILRIQREFCHALEAEETKGTKFLVDRWDRQDPKEGGGITCVLQDGETFEKAGVNITVMRAPLSKLLQENMRARGKDLPENENFTFFAAGVSSVIHPRNPHVPTIHFNYRYFEVQDKEGNKRDYWFGGGTDLTPYYLVEDDVQHFHHTLKSACDTYNKDAYHKYKRWCDEYFYIKYRDERRGVGGIFFDDLQGNNEDEVFQFVENCAKSVIPSYIPLVKKNKNRNVTEEERNWQLLRRGRYAEFNLVYDRGTKFGFATPGARIESILMSLPLVAKWQYRHEPTPDSPEDKLLQVLKNPRDWI